MVQVLTGKSIQEANLLMALDASFNPGAESDKRFHLGVLLLQVLENTVVSAGVCR